MTSTPTGSGSPYAQEIGKQLITSAPMILEELAEVPMLVVYGAAGLITGDYTNAKFQAAGVLLPFISGSLLGILTKHSNILQPNGKTFIFDIKDGKINLDDGWSDFIITKDGELRIGAGHHHLAKDGADELIGAGEIYIKDGKIDVVNNNNSGHYKPTKSELENQSKILRDQGLTTTDFISINYNN